MKLIRNVEPLSDDGDQADNILTSLICSAGLLMCMVFAIFGIKFRWFKHRLSFQQLPDTSDRGGGTSTNSQNGSIVPLSQGVFRRREDADSFVDIERPKTLPPIRIRSTDVQIPVPNRLSQITPTHHPASTSGTTNAIHPPNPPPMPNVPSSASLNQNRSERSNRSQASSSRSKSSERSKKSDDQTTASAKSASSSSSPRKKKGQDDSKSKSSSSTNPQSAEPNKKPRDKDKNKEKTRKAPVGVTFEPRKPKKHSDQTRHFEKLKDDRQNVKAVGERRPTGFIRPSDEEMEALEKLSSLEDAAANRAQVDGLSDNDEESQVIFEKVKAKPVPEPRKRVSSENASVPIPPPPVASVASKPADSWSAVARHRILTEELTKQHSALKPVSVEGRSNGTGEFRNPLSASTGSPSAESKPRTMRDMKKSKDVMSHNDRVVLGQEQQREDTEA